MMPFRYRALSLIEVLVCLVILSILLSLAAPSFNTFIQHGRRVTHVNQMLAMLSFARSKAITSRAMISLCAGEAGCSNSSHWKKQILVFGDANQNGLLDGNESVLKTDPIEEGYSWSWSNFRNQHHMSFKANGTTHSLNGTFTLCEHAEPVRNIVINAAGRARLATPSSSAPCLQ